MSRTIRKAPKTLFRHPKGKVNAVAHGARPGSIPPDAYDDLHHNREAWRFYKVAHKLQAEGWDEERIIAHVLAKYKAKVKFYDALDGKRYVCVAR